MKAWMMALIAGAARVLKSAGPYTATAIFPVPVKTTKIESITGKGQNGAPAASSSEWKLFQYEQYTYNNTSTGTTTTGSIDIVDVSDSYAGAPVPASYFGPFEFFAWGNRRAKYTFENKLITNSTPAKTGANTVAFGRTFPGGVSGPATEVTFTDVPTTGGSSQTLTIPAGGSITSFTYYDE